MSLARSLSEFDTADLRDEEFGTELLLLTLFWMSLFLAGSWTLLNYGELARSVFL